VADNQKISWRDPVVLAAIVTSVGSLVITVVQVRGTNNDIRDSYKVTSEAINKLSLQVGQLDGKIDAHIAWHQSKAQAIKAAVAAPIEEKPKPHKVIVLGTVDIHGDAHSTMVGMDKPAADSDLIVEYKSDSGVSDLVAGPPPAAPTTATSVLSTDLKTALESERAK
jgi:hypothetical protein